MTQKQWRRLETTKRWLDHEIGGREAVALLRVSERHAWRVRAAVAAAGELGVVHGNTGRPAWNRTPDEVRKRILQLARKKYVGFNDHHLRDKLEREEGIEVSCSTVRRLLRAAGLASPRRRRPPKHRARRERMGREGWMMLWDGSRHDWLEGRGPLLCLMGALDDATGAILPGAHFVSQECAAGYLVLLRETVRHKGIPHLVYMDRHGSLHRNDENWTVEEQLQGDQLPTHVGQALRDLDIGPIFALSPQAKGRVERLWKTLQDRLVSELRLAKARTIDDANRVLQRYIPEHNAVFAVAARESPPAWRPLLRHLDLDRICSFRHEATVANDNTVRIGGVLIDIPPGPGTRSYAHARVDVRQLLDGSWRVYWHDQLIARHDSTGPAAPGKRRRRRSAAERAFRNAIHRVAASLP